MYFRQGMTTEERQQFREWYRERLMERLERDMRENHHSMTCFKGHHRTCKGEKPGNSGCLCECHDVVGDTG